MSALSEDELQEIVHNLEQILEVFPNDTAVLHTLIEAYRRQGLEEKFTECLLQLAETATNTQDQATAELTLSLMERVAAVFPNQEEVVNRLRRVSQSDSVSAAVGGPSSQSAKVGRSISGELALAWKLMKADEIDQEEYSSIVTDLTENATKQMDIPVSVLHVLQDRGMKNLEKILAAIIVDSGVPLISLSNFELEPQTCMELSAHFMTRRGAILFERMGDHALVALLNPYDRVLQNEIQHALKRPCHFYVTSAQEYDRALESIMPHIQAAAEAAAEAEAEPVSADEAPADPPPEEAPEA